MPRTARIAPKEHIYHTLTRGNNRQDIFQNAMKGEMDKRVIYGSESFLDTTTRKYKIEAVIKPKGRPKNAGKKNK